MLDTSVAIPRIPIVRAKIRLMCRLGERGGGCGTSSRNIIVDGPPCALHATQALPRAVRIIKEIVQKAMPECDWVMAERAGSM